MLGERVAFDANGPQMRALERDVIAAYEADYAQAWDAMLADLNVVQQRSLSQAAQDLYILASPQSPMRSLLASVARQLTLSVRAGLAAPQAGSRPGLGDRYVASRLQSVLGNPTSATAAALPPGHEIDERYKALIDLVGEGPGAPIDQVLRSLERYAAAACEDGRDAGQQRIGCATPPGIDPHLPCGPKRRRSRSRWHAG